jgi:hypothetical protein
MKSWLLEMKDEDDFEGFWSPDEAVPFLVPSGSRRKFLFTAVVSEVCSCRKPSQPSGGKSAAATTRSSTKEKEEELVKYRIQKTILLPLLGASWIVVRGVS